MKGVVKFAHGVGNVELRDVPEPEAGPGEVKVEVKAAGVCGTDLHIYHDEYPSNPPVVLGHELSGVVSAKGPGAAKFSVGDRVTSRTFFVTCGECEYCRTGRENLCARRLSIGSGVNGAMAKYVVVPEDRLHLLPDNVSFLAGALSEPLACTVHAVLHANRPTAGDSVLVIGPGAIGLLAMQVAKATGAHVSILGTPSDEARLRLATKLGVDEVMLTTQVEDLRRQHPNGYFDSVIECSGAAGGIETGLNLVRKAGKYTQVGLTGKQIPLDIDQLVYKEIDFSATFAHRWADWGPALKLLGDGAVQTEPLVSHRYPLSQWEEAFRMFNTKEGVKIVLEPEE
ncbi:MAG: zinc-dependent alcohol dehydrogenase [Chloroflexota bacterium]